MGDLRKARVIKVHDEANAVDLVFLDDGSRVPMVQVLGSVDVSRLPAITPVDPANPMRLSGKRDVFAAVDTFRGGLPVVTGFMKGQVNGTLFKGRPNFWIDDHPSDFYRTMDDAGNLTMAWPNGTSVVVGEDPDPEDLTGQDFDAKRAAPERNTSRAMHLRLVLKDGAGDQAALIHITPAGVGTLILKGGLDVQIGGNLGLEVDGSITSSASGWTHTGPLDIAGKLTATGDIESDGTVKGAVDVIAGTKSGKTHVHASNGAPPT